MKTEHESCIRPGICARGSLLVAALLFCAAGASALTWDAGSNGTNMTGTIITGSGNWDLVTSNWNNGSSNVLWTQNSSTSASTNAAIFGDGVDTNFYFITNSVQIAVTNLAINNSGYTFSGSPIYLSSGGLLAVAAGKSATFNCNFASGNSAELYWAGPGATISVTGNFSGQQPRFAGPANNCAYYFSGINVPSVLYVLAPVYQTNGSLTTSASFFIGYGSTVNGTNYNTGSLTLSGGATATQNGGNLVVARGGGTGTLTLLDGTVNIGISGSTARSLAICNDGNGNEHGIVNVYGGTMNVGTVGSTTLKGQLLLSPGGSAPGEYSILNQTNGVINAWGGIEFGEAAGTYTGGSSLLTNSGGALYIGPGGIIYGGVYAPTNNITFSGGTVGALGNWASALPITLGTLNGNITFLCGDANNNSYNINLSGPLTGAGGLNVAGSGILTLSSTNSYAGSTVVSNGTLQILTTPVASSSGPVTVDGAQGASALTIQSNPGQNWSIGGLTFQNGTTMLTNNFGTLTPSTTVAPIQVSGNVAFQTSPNVTVNGSAIPANTFPLIKYTGTLSGSVPSSVALPANMSGYLTNIVATKTIAVVVIQSPFSPVLVWAVGNGIWDTATKNWDQNGVPVAYADGEPVLLDDTASGASPIIIAINGAVNPLGISANNLAKSYTLTGTGSITGAGNLVIAGGGTLTLTGMNSYSGGTVLSAGQLNLNNGGDASGQNSAIGTGPLTIAGGTVLDNTSGSNVTLIPLIQEAWNGSFSYAGSSNNLNLGLGNVTLNSHLTLTVVSNTLEVDGPINDNGNNYKLTKQGNGSLTLNGVNTIGGGFELFSGELKLGNSTALGSGICTIDGGVLDNSSGADLTIYPASYFWFGSFTYLGTSNNLDLGPGQCLVQQPLTVNVVTNTLITEGDISPGNSTVTKTGMGTWDISGYGTTAENMNLSISQGTVLFDKSSGYVVNGAYLGLLIQSNALAFETGVGGAQIAHGNGRDPVAVSTGGALDLNGKSETVDAFNCTNGILRNSAVGGTSTLAVTFPGAVINLSGTNCLFEVPDPTGVLNLNGIVAGTGSLVMTGAGQLNLNETNTYTGNTTITAGTLALIAPSLASTSTVTIVSNGAAINLNFVNNDTNQIGALILHGVSQPPGLYNASTTPAITGSGSLLVVPPVTINPLPGALQFSLSGGTVGLSWPTNLGWILQSQTNGLNAGLLANSNAWFDVAGSGALTATNITINATNSAVFYRLRQP